MGTTPSHGLMPTSANVKFFALSSKNTPRKKNLKAIEVMFKSLKPFSQSAMSLCNVPNVVERAKGYRRNLLAVMRGVEVRSASTRRWGRETKPTRKTLSGVKPSSTPELLLSRDFPIRSSWTSAGKRNAVSMAVLTSCCVRDAFLASVMVRWNHVPSESRNLTATEVPLRTTNLSSSALPTPAFARSSSSFSARPLKTITWRFSESPNFSSSASLTSPAVAGSFTLTPTMAFVRTICTFTFLAFLLPACTASIRDVVNNCFVSCAGESTCTRAPAAN
mmetsp:Transcript_67934/g.196741  ORF Transcript_67934/g.196741 Transcript_67934/m.196741 type:complete len:277 (-) Transcript_67934:310-1140(-)